MSIWTIEGAVDELRRLCTIPDFSADDIAASLSKQFAYVTRSAVIGKCQRLKIALPRAGEHKPKTTRPPRETMPRPRRTRIMRPPLRLVCQPVVAPAETDDGAPINGGVSFDELSNVCCRWPFGDPRQPGLRYCGQNIQTGTGYKFCTYHLQRARRAA